MIAVVILIPKYDNPGRSILTFQLMTDPLED